MYTQLHRVGKRCGCPEGIEPSCGVFDVLNPDRTVKYRFVVDCGLMQVSGARIGEKNWYGVDLSIFGDGKLIDGVFLTHAHTDHVGFAPSLMPYLAKDAKFWMSKPTAAILPRGFEDGLQIAAKRQTDPPFSSEQMFACLDRLSVIEREGVFTIPGTDIRVLAWPAGHINGACSYTFRVGRKHIHYAGDRCEHNQPGILGAKPLPQSWTTDLVVAGMDGTYGGDFASDTRDRAEELNRFHGAVSDIVRHGGLAVLPAFAINRGGGLAHELTRRGLPNGAEVILDGACRYYADEQRLPSGEWSDRDVPLFLDDVYFVGDGRDRKRLRESTGGRAIVTTSGMGSGGPFNAWREDALEDPRASVMFTGYVAPGTDGNKIIIAAEERARTGQPVDVSFEEVDMRSGEVYVKTYRLRCDVKQFRLGSHDSRQRTLDWLWHLHPEVAVLSHGGESALASLEQSLKGQIPRIIRSDLESMVEVEC